MAVYAIYHINMYKSQQKALNLSEQEHATGEMYQNILEDLLKGSIPVNKLERDNTTLTPLECTVDCKRDRVTLLLLCNEKSHKYLEKKDKEELIYHPGCYVIIYNRVDVSSDGTKGVIYMAIERTPAFENKPDKVRDLLGDSDAAYSSIDDAMLNDLQYIAEHSQIPFDWKALRKTINEYKDQDMSIHLILY